MSYKLDTVKQRAEISSMESKNRKKPHHHGDLPKALVDAGLHILDESGLQALTLRACAARAGVSHAAPKHHFGNLTGLLTAIATRGFDIFTATMEAERALSPAEPYERVEAICRGYIKFSQSHPALFALMFNTTAPLKPDAAFKRAADAAYGVLSDACAPFEPVSEDPRSTEIMIWSLVHGLACLRLGGRFKPENNRMDLPEISAILPKLKLRK